METVKKSDRNLAEGKGVTKKTNRSRQAVEIAVLTVLLVVVWGLLALPIVFFHLPVETEPLQVTEASINESRVECFPYPTTASGSVCQTELTDTLLSLNCDTGETPLVLRDAESSATPPSQLLPLLQFLNPSPACSEAVVPFLCVFLFGLCDSSGVSIQPTSTQCEHIRDVLCPDEWAQAEEFTDLPNCDSFPTEQNSCPVSSGIGSGNGLGQFIEENSTTSKPLDCREDFFREEEGGPCVPSCFTWTEFSQTEAIVKDVIIGSSAMVGLLAGIVVIVTSCIRFKRMFTFPSIIVVITTVDVLIIEIFILISYFDRPSLYCTSMNLLDSLLESTPFCVITGMAFLYLMLQLVLWWFFHTTMLSWNIYFPIHAKSYQLTNKIKYIKNIAFAVSFVLPLISVITPMINFAVDVESDALLRSKNITFASGGLGFRVIRFPPNLCSGGDRNAVYYSTVLPVNTIMFIVITELIFVFNSIRKHHGISKFGTAERKIMIILCYYVIMTTFALIAFTLATRNSAPFSARLLDYFLCEQPGHNPDAPCDRNIFQQLSHPEVATVAVILVTLIPLVNLVYAINSEELKEACGTRCGKKGKKCLPCTTQKSSQVILNRMALERARKRTDVGDV